MNFVQEIRAMLREKNGKGQFALSLIVFLLATALVFYAAFTLCEHIWVRLMDEYLWEMPAIIESRRNELALHSSAFEEDMLTRAEVGRKLYQDENGLPEAEKLEWVRASVSAASVTLTDGSGKTLATTGPVSPEETYRDSLQALKTGQPHLAFYDNKQGKSDGMGFVMLSLPADGAGSATRGLVFEFTIEPILELVNGLYDVVDVMEDMISEEEGAIYARIDGVLPEQMTEGLPADQAARLREELNQVFGARSGFRSTGDSASFGYITLLGQRFLAGLSSYTLEGEEPVEFLMTLPARKVLGNGAFIALAISLIIGWGILLLQHYIFRKLQQQEAGKAEAGQTETGSAGGGLGRRTWPGLAVMLAVTILFSNMLFLLESRSLVTSTAQSMREFIGREIEWRKGQEGLIRSSFENYYRTRTQLLAAYLKEHPEKLTRAGLEELRRAAGAEYVMRFDGEGRELVSSNSYRNFTVGKNLSEDYQAVLLGYPYAIVGPETDAYSGRTQIGAAILMEDAEGAADGFLLAVYSAGDLNRTLKSMSYENAVNSFAVRTGYAAATRDEDGRFIAHTVPEMIGQKAADYLGDYEPGTSFEGFTDYLGVKVCVSARASDGKTLLFITPERTDAYLQRTFGLFSLAVILLLALGYYPWARRLMKGALEQAKLPRRAEDRNPLIIFADGYAYFLLLFAIATLIASWNGWWTSFDYVFSGQWSPGVHLYSFWAALFILAITNSLLSLIRMILRRIEGRVGLQGRTVARLAGSLLTYAASLFLLFRILSIFGVNTTALVASAGIISIAVGMGAQSMASDLLAGFFMMLEGSVRVGDRVSIGNIASGTVTDMGIRTTEITDAEGNVFILNNSKVSPIRNMSRNQKKLENPEDGKPDGEKPADEKPAEGKKAEKKPASEKPAKQG